MLPKSFKTCYSVIYLLHIFVFKIVQNMLLCHLLHVCSGIYFLNTKGLNIKGELLNSHFLPLDLITDQFYYHIYVINNSLITLKKIKKKIQTGCYTMMVIMNLFSFLQIYQISLYFLSRKIRVSLVIFFIF